MGAILPSKGLPVAYARDYHLFDTVVLALRNAVKKT
jgi:hypothetical protein